MKKHKIPAVSEDTKGGKSAMSGMNPQKPDSMRPPSFARKGIKIHDEGPDTWKMHQTERYEHD